MNEKPPTLLLLTDASSTELFFSRTLKGIHLIFESNERIALDLLRTTEINYIAIDEDTPEFPITDVLSQIRSIESHKKTPIWVITPSLKRSHSRKLLRAGATDLLREPLNEAELLQRIEVANRLSGTQIKMSSMLSRIPAMKRTGKKLETKNRFVLSDTASKEISKELKSRDSVSLLLLELDHFDQISKSFGDETLDQAIDLLEELLKNVTRVQDTLIEIGGGKFVIILPNTSERAALIIAETIKESIDLTKFETSKGLSHLTVSIGLVTEEAVKLKQGNATKSIDRMIHLAQNKLTNLGQHENQIATG